MKRTESVSSQRKTMSLPGRVARYLVRQYQSIADDGLDGLRFVRNDLELRLRRSVLRQRLLRRRFDGFQMYLYTRDAGISNALVVYGKREEDQVHMIRTEIMPGMRVLDIGANIGFYALLEATLVGERGRVYAAEPAPDNFRLLAKNIALNRLGTRVLAEQMAISNVTGDQTFYLHRKSNLHTFNPVKFRAGTSDDYIRTVEVRTSSMQELARRWPDIQFIRMDIEGHEVEVFESMIPAVRAGFSPKIMFECHFPKYDDERHSMRRPLSELLALGYRAKIMASNGMSEQGFRGLGYTPFKVIPSSGRDHCLYANVAAEDALKLVCDIGSVRAVLLERGRADGAVSA